nr:PREDICTED: uncharacterized protein LOC656546 [Tribolium castaneum]|eukprot:XP_008199215.1 PREDICTED: uncharacterized protein LOC656546 [Tribolium castaneum]
MWKKEQIILVYRQGMKVQIGKVCMEVVLIFVLSDRSHSVVVLPIHWPNEQDIMFDEDADEERIEELTRKPSKLMAWFELNRTDPEAHIYADIPEYYTWQNKDSKWTKRRQVSKTIGTLAEVNFREGERYYLRLLLKVTPGATSFEQLKTVNGGRVMNSFQDACRELHFLDDSNTYDEALNEIVLTKRAFEVRELFGLSIVCMINEGADMNFVRDMYIKYKNYLIDDFQRRYGDNEDVAEQKALYHIKMYLQRSNLPVIPSMKDLGLPDVTLPENLHHLVPLTFALQEYTETGQTENNVFYVDGPGGTGKTYLYNVLQLVTRKRLRQTYMAWTGMAATLLKEGKTVHKSFRLPLQLTEYTVAGFKEDSPESDAIKKARLIIWDEASMAPRKAVLAIDRYLRRLMNVDQEFGGKIFVFGGDFRQLLPVVPRGHAGEIVNECVQALPFWNRVVLLKLTENMRYTLAAAEGVYVVDNAFPTFLLSIGEGKVPKAKIAEAQYGVPSDLIEIPQQYLVFNLEDLLAHVFRDIRFDEMHDDNDKIALRAVLCPKNVSVQHINAKILETFPGPLKIFYAQDAYDAAPDDISMFPKIILIAWKQPVSLHLSLN